MDRVLGQFIQLFIIINAIFSLSSICFLCSSCYLCFFKVEKESRAEEVGLKRADQILEVNGHNFTQITHAKALDILRSTTHLALTVKSNFLGAYFLLV